MIIRKVKISRFSLFMVFCVVSFFASNLYGFTGRSDISSDQVEILQQNLIQNLKDSISKWLSDYNIPGMVIAVVNGQGIVWEAEFGYTTDEKTVAVDSHTLFSLQSISKNVTALAVLKAVQDGLLDLDAPVTHYLPEFTVKSRYEKNPEQKITLRHLLSHRSGLSHRAPVGNYFDSNPHPFEDHISSISDTWLKYPVGQCFSYSNLGIDLAGYILQKVSGLSFDENVKTNILDPLGMTHSTFNSDIIQSSSNCAHGHHKEFSSPPVRIPMIPAGGFYSNSEDMAKLVQFHINKGMVKGKQFLSENLMEQMHSVAFPIKGQNSGFGLCMEIERINRDVSRIYHTGSGYGFMCAIHIYPALNMGAVLLYNSHDYGARNDFYSVINQTVSELIKKERVDVNSFVEGLKAVDAADPRLKDITGIYLYDIQIIMKDNQLTLSTGGGSAPLQIFSGEGGKLVGLIKDRYYLEFFPPLKGQTRGYIRFFTSSGDILDMCHYNKPFEKEDKPGPNKPEWQKTAGPYHAYAWIKENKHSFEISIENGYICIDSKRCREFLLGLFFTPDGDVLDLRGDQPRYMYVTLIKEPVF